MMSPAAMAETAYKLMTSAFTQSYELFYSKGEIYMIYSIMFPKKKFEESQNHDEAQPKDYFKDLGLDLVFKSVLETKQEFSLEKYFYNPIQDIEVITYRQDIMNELENKELRKKITNFTNEIYALHQSMNEIREKLTSQDVWSNNFLIRGHMLDYAQRYCLAVDDIKNELANTELKSQGFLDFSHYIEKYHNSKRYKDLKLSISDLRKQFSKIEYAMLLNGNTIKVRKFENQKDYASQISSTFDKFAQGDVKDYRHQLEEKPKADHVEVGVLNLLSKIYQKEFEALTQFTSNFISFDDKTLVQFSNDIEFYVSWLYYIEPIKNNGLEFNYPKMAFKSNHVYSHDCFDIALAHKIPSKIILNDFTLRAPESLIVVTGPNQGGKTTFARMIGQVHYLASLGLSVPGKESSLFLFDNIFTHFSTEEDLSTENGKLKDDLERLYKITTKATDKSIVIINEIFTSTTLKDAKFLGKEMINHLIDIKVPGVIVTFIDDLAVHSEATVSMMSTVKDDDIMERTYKVIRKRPDGSAYAMHIASKHGLTYEKLSRRLKQ